MIEIGKLVERQLAIAFGWTKQVGFGASVRWQVRQLFHAGVARCARIAIPQAASAGKLLQASVEHPAPEAMFKALMKISYLPKLFFDPAGFNFLLKHTDHRGREIVFLHCLESGLRGEHSTLDCQVDSFQALLVLNDTGATENHPA